MRDIQDDIILAFKQGSLDAFDAIYDQLHQPIFTFCSYMVPVEDAEEITADIFVRLWKSREQWDTIVNVKAFLYISARNACFNCLRSRKVRTRHHENLAEISQREPEYIQLAEIESDLVTLIKEEIDKLPDRCRTVFKLSYFDGYDNPEIAKLLNISYQRVSNLKSMALNAIRKNLKNKGLQLSAFLLLMQMLKRIQ